MKTEFCKNKIEIIKEKRIHSFLISFVFLASFVYLNAAAPVLAGNSGDPELAKNKQVLEKDRKESWQHAKKKFWLEKRGVHESRCPDTNFRSYAHRHPSRNDRHDAPAAAERKSQRELQQSKTGKKDSLPGEKPKIGPEQLKTEKKESLANKEARKLAEEIREIYPKVLYGGKNGRKNLTDELKEKKDNGGKISRPDLFNLLPFGFGIILPALAFGLILAASMASKNTLSKRGKSGAGGSDASADADKLNSAQQWMQCARDQAAQAETAASRACVGNRSMRLAAASQAQCHADSARSWADRASQKAYGSNAAAGAVAAARDAANRAQAAADKARYYAETARD